LPPNTLVLENTRHQCDRTAGQALVNGHTASGVKPSQVHEKRNKKRKMCVK